MAKPQGLFAVLDVIIDPLVRADGGELYAAAVSPERVVLHLRGRFSGCPGNTLAIRRVIEPALTTVAPRCAVVVSAGELVPEGALPWSEWRTRLGQAPPPGQPVPPGQRSQVGRG
jgi:Fe-S cluster biogenesis protein NfuA